MKKLLLSVSLTASLMLSGCLGQNALFNTIQDWNVHATKDKFANQAISFVFWWVPVYGLSLFADIIVINSIEFWTGTNPLSNKGAKVAGTTEHVEDGLGNYAELTYNADGSVSVVAVNNDVEENYRLERRGDQVIKLQEQDSQVLGSIVL